MRQSSLHAAVFLCLFYLSGFLCPRVLAQTPIPTSIYVVTAGGADVWAVGQGIVLTAQVSEATFNAQTDSLTPTGTMQFYANGQPLGAPAELAAVLQGLGRATMTAPIQTPGSYIITATYSGDANFAPVTGTFGGTPDLPIVVAANPATLLPVGTPSSLTFKAGATTGNTLSIDVTDVNNCECSAQWNTTFAPVPGAPVPGNPATMTFINAPNNGVDGNGGTISTVQINSTAPRVVTEGRSKPSGSVFAPPVVALAGLLLLLPYGGKRLPRSLVLVIGFAGLLSVVGCGGVNPSTGAAATQTTETVPGSAGQYYVTVQGETYYSPANNGGGTYFSVNIPVTIQ
jgi:hypothetical protein